MKLSYQRIILFLIAFMLVSACFAQKQSRKVRKAVHQTEKKELQMKRAYEKARKKEIKHRQKIQNPEVQKRMKQSKKDANLYNKKIKRKDPFLKRLFRKRRR
jgi:Ni/Co efflux regulator RcnB